MATDDKQASPLDQTKAWKLLEDIALAGLKEQRRARRWGIFFKLLTFIYLLVLVLLMLPTLPKAGISGPHTALVELKGQIADDKPASADHLVAGLREAFADQQAKAVLLRINSPGGSPVQSGYIYDEIKRLRSLHPDKKLYAVITDLGASGAYYVASAADQIYADKASLVGSIGVTAASFGFVGAMEKLGIDRRVYTSGEHKAFLDPFQPPKADETQFWQQVLDITHRQFINSVKAGRGDRLKVAEHPELFTGLVWSGEQALELGLIDGLGSASYVAREKIGADKFVDYTVKDSPFDRFSKRLGAELAERLAIWTGFGGPQLR